MYIGQKYVTFYLLLSSEYTCTLPLVYVRISTLTRRGRALRPHNENMTGAGRDNVSSQHQGCGKTAVVFRHARSRQSTTHAFTVYSSIIMIHHIRRVCPFFAFPPRLQLSELTLLSASSQGSTSPSHHTPSSSCSRCGVAAKGVVSSSACRRLWHWRFNCGCA